MEWGGCRGTRPPRARAQNPPSQAASVRPKPSGCRLPVDRAGTITEVTTLVTAGLMSKAYALNYLSSKLGFSFPPDMLDQVAAEADAVGARVNNELNGVPA